METEPPQLTFALLDSLLERAVAYGPPGAEKALAPGLTSEAIDGATSHLGFKLPPEAKTLWEWRDGCDARFYWLFYGRAWPSIEGAIALRSEQLEIANDEWAREGGEPKEWWPESFFPLFDSDEDVCAVDCRSSEDAFSPVYLMDLSDRRPGAPPQTRSIGELVTWWIEAYDVGLTRFDRERDEWVYDESKLIFERRHVT